MLWILRSPVFVRNFDAILRTLAERGHHVHVAFEGDKSGYEDDQRSLIGELAAAYPQITVGTAPMPGRMASLVRSRLRGTADYLRYFGPEYVHATALRARARRHSLPGVAMLAPLLRRSDGFRRGLASTASALARAGPPPRRIVQFLRERDADVLVVSPLTHFGSPQPDYLRAAWRRGLPSALVVFSWDNLTNKGLMHTTPQLVLVWNELQAHEAAQHHGVAPTRVEVTGAAAYDHWFGWRPRTRERFLTDIGLDPGQPCILYVCSSGFIAPDEPAWVEDWIDALRAARGPLARANIIVRPHPLNVEGWRSDPLRGRTGVAVFPSLGEDPRSQRARQAYFDSIHHSAFVVGINTTALVESAIIGRRSFTVLTPRFAQTQDGTLHFQHLREAHGGPLRIADSMAQHLAQLTEALTSGDDDDIVHLRAFVQRFIRPRGLDADVAPYVAERIEALIRTTRSRCAPE